MATRYESVYEYLDTMALEFMGKYDYDNKSSAFGHIILKMLFGLSDDDIYDLNTDGYDDNGIDAIYIDEEENIAHFFQFKFPNTIDSITNGVGESDVKSVHDGFLAFTGNDAKFSSHTWNDILLEKREEFEKLKIYKFKLWTVKYSVSSINEKIERLIRKQKLEYESSTGNDIDIEILTANKLSTLYENNIRDKWCDFLLKFKKSLTPFSDDVSKVFSCYVSLNEVYNTFNSIKGKVFEGNVRYLSPNSKINEGIKETLSTDEKRFFHLLNNGITIFCKNCNENTTNDRFDIKNGSIINGAQTVGTILNYLDNLSEEERNNYNEQFLFVKIVQVDEYKEIMDRMVYTLNTQNEMKNSYAISNEIPLKQLQERFNNESKYFLELKNNEFVFYKESNPSSRKMARDKIDIETLVQVVATYYDILGLANVAKNNKAFLFRKENIKEIIEKLNFEDSIKIYEKYLYLMKIIKSYRSYRKNSENKNILELLDIVESEIDTYRYLNTGNFILLFGLGVYERIHGEASESEILKLIKYTANSFTGEDNLAIATRTLAKFTELRNSIIAIGADL